MNECAVGVSALRSAFDLSTFGHVSSVDPMSMDDSCPPSSDAGGGMPLPLLPALPSPRPLRWRQRIRSVAIVFGAAASGLIFVHALSAASSGVDRAHLAWTIVLFLAYAHTAVAVVGLVLIQLADPGIIRRSDDTCRPLPAPVVERLRAAEPLTGLTNLRDSDGSGSFCVRCCVWRPPTAHHCSICQRCVRDFDHHCSIFGGCIGGSTPECKGNLLLFKINIGNLMCSPATAGVALVVMLAQHVGAVALFIVLCPASAICIGCLRSHGDDIAALFLGHKRRRRPRQRIEPVGADDAISGLTELNDAARMALEAERDGDGELHEGDDLGGATVTSKRQGGATARPTAGEEARSPQRVVDEDDEPTEQCRF